MYTWVPLAWSNPIARPQSPILGSKCLSNKMLLLLISPCEMSWECKYARPWAVPHAMFALWYQVLKIKINDVQQKFYLLELDRVYPNSKTQWVSAIFPNPNPKNPISKDYQNLNSKKPQKLKFDQMQFSRMQNFAKKRCIMAKFWSNSVNTSFETVFLDPKSINTKIFGILKPKKLKPIPSKRQLNSNPKKSKLNQALLLTVFHYVDY